MDKGRFGDIKIGKIYPVEDCLFYTIEKTLMDKDADDIDDIEEFKKRLDKDGINCIKINNNGQIFYRQAISKEKESEISEEKREQEIKKDSNDFNTIYSKLFEYSKESLKPDSTNTNSSGLPTVLIKEYAKRQTGGKPVNYIEAEIDEAPDGGVRPPIYIRNIEYNAIETEGEIKSGNGTITQGGNTITQGDVGTTQSIARKAKVVGKLFKVFNPNNKPLETYILGTPTHVSSFMVRDNDIFYLFDATGHTHQMQQRQTPQTLKPQAQKLQVLKLQIQKSQEQQSKVQHYTSELIFDKEIPLLSNGLNTIQPEGKINIRPILLNPFGLDYQNSSSACDIWTSNILAVASTYENIKDFIIKDEEESHIAMFKSEFILKVSAKVAEALSAERPEVKILEQKNDSSLEGGYYCKCKVGNTLFAIDTTYKAGSCLNINCILLSLSQKELEFYNDNNINNEIIERRKLLVENIKADKAKYETIMNMMKTSYVDKLEKSDRKIVKQEAVDLNKLESEIAKLKEEIKLENIDTTKLEEAKESKQLEYYTKLVQYFTETFNIKNNGTISDMIRGTKLYCKRQIKIANNQLAHAEKVDKLFKPNCIRIVHEEEKTPTSNTKSQQSDYSIGHR